MPHSGSVCGPMYYYSKSTCYKINVQSFILLLFWTEMNSTTWAGILVASMAILFVMICFGIPLCLIAIKAINW